MLWFKKKKQEEKFDHDENLLLMMKSANMSDFTLGKINRDAFELQDAEIEAVGMRIVERRVANIEHRRNGKALEN